MTSDPLRVALYSHDAKGLGHLRRNLALAHHLARALPGLTGPLASLILPSISVGTLFLGVEGLDERGAYAQHDGEAAINAALVEAAEHVVIVCDSSKLGSTAFALICPTASIDVVITDDGAPTDQVEALRRAGVEVRLV